VSERRARSGWLVACAFLALVLAQCSIEDRKVQEVSRAGSGNTPAQVPKAGSGAYGPSQVPAAGASGNRSAGAGAVPAAAQGRLLDALREFAVQDCTKFSACTRFLFELSYRSVEECRDRVMLQLAWVASLPGVGWNEQNITACIRGRAQASCAQFVADDEPSECSPPGTRALGQPCNIGDQCASRFCNTHGYNCGVCAVAPAEHAPCTEDNDCAVGQLCVCEDGNAFCAQHNCVRMRNDGEACSATEPCGHGLNCLSDSRCHKGPNSLGAACNPSQGIQCDWTDEGFLCSGGSCVKSTRGSSCSSATEFCGEVWASCLPSGACLSPASDDGACNVATGPGCRHPATCVNGKCQLPGKGSLCPAK